MTYGLTPEGFIPKPLAVIKEEQEAELKAVFGNQLDTDLENIFGQLIGIYSEREALLWAELEKVYNSAYPDTAEEVPLDNAISLTGHLRFPATYSRIPGVELIGEAGTIVQAGTIFSVDGSPDIRFRTEIEVVMTGTGDVVDCIAETTGPIRVNADTLTVVDTPISGLTAVRNPNPAAPGRNLESDAEVKIRRNSTLQIFKAGPTGAIKASVLELNLDEDAIAIESVEVFENVTGGIDAEGRPPKCFEVVAYQAGGLTDRDQEIAQAIYDSKPAGILAYGDVENTVLDSKGKAHIISFSRPTMRNIYLELDLTVTGAYPTDGDEQLKIVLVSWGNGLGLGGSVIVMPVLVAQISNIPGVTDVTVRIGTAPDPTLDDNIDIGETEISVWDADRITVNS